MCWSSFHLHKLAFCRLDSKGYTEQHRVWHLSHVTKAASVLFEWLASFTNAKTCRALFILAGTSGTPSASKRRIFPVSVEEKLAQTSSDLFQHFCCYFFLFFCFERDMLITKGTVSHLSWERRDRPSCLTWKHCCFLFLFFKMQKQIKAHRLHVQITSSTAAMWWLWEWRHGCLGRFLACVTLNADQSWHWLSLVFLLLFLFLKTVYTAAADGKEHNSPTLFPSGWPINVPLDFASSHPCDDGAWRVPFSIYTRCPDVQKSWHVLMFRE